MYYFELHVYLSTDDISTMLQILVFLSAPLAALHNTKLVSLLLPAAPYCKVMEQVTYPYVTHRLPTAFTDRSQICHRTNMAASLTESGIVYLLLTILNGYK